MITSAPSARSSRAFSCDILSGIVKMQRYPFTAAASASPTPVLPDVASTIRPPGLSRPSRSAASIIARPIRSFTEPPGLKYSALAYTGVRIPWVTRFRRTRGVQPIVSRMLPYGLAWDGIRIRFRRAVRDRAYRVQGARERVPSRRCRIAPHRAHRSRCGSCGCAHRSRSGTRGVRLPLRDGATRLRMPKLDRLEERRGNRQAVPPGRSETQLARAHEGRRIERGIAARLGHSARFRLEPPRRIDEQAQDHVALDFLYDQKVEGDVILRLFVDSTGRLQPESSRVAEPSGYPALDSAALMGARKLRFAPARRHGLAIATAFLQPVEFRHPQASGAVSKGEPDTTRPKPAPVRAPVVPAPAPVRRDSTPARRDTFPRLLDTTRAVPDSAKPDSNAVP